MASSSLEFAPIPSLEDLPTCIPNLMPFHIDYSGPAPISTYFRVEPGNARVGAPPSVETSYDVAPETSTNVGDQGLSNEKAGTSATAATSLGMRVTAAASRFIASFRGRTVQGLKVELPKGYGGVVLRAKDESDGGNDKGKAKEKAKTAKGKGKGKVVEQEKAKGKARGRNTRRSTRAMEEEDDDQADADMDIDVNEEENDNNDALNPDGPAVRTLIPTSTFSSFVLWHSDIPVDEGKDEYFRSLTEWTQLAERVRFCVSFTRHRPYAGDRYTNLKSNFLIVYMSGARLRCRNRVLLIYCNLLSVS